MKVKHDVAASARRSIRKHLGMPPEDVYKIFSISHSREDGLMSPEKFGVEVGRRYGYFSSRVIVVSGSAEV